MTTRLLCAALLLLAACSSADRDDAPAPPGCGNGVREGLEDCDDGNINAGDGCSSVCTMETGGGGNAGTCGSPFTLTPVDNGMGQLEAQGMGDTSASTDQIGEALCDGFDTGAAADHVWQFTVSVPSDVVVMTDEGTVFDSVLRVMSAPCDVMTEISEYGEEDGCSDGEGATEVLGYVRLQPGTYYVAVDGFTPEDVGAYSFTFLAWPTTCGDGVVDELELCDDGNSAVDDGCDDKCEVETGYACDESSPSVCTPDTSSAEPPMPGDLVLNEFMAADNASDTNCDNATTGTADEFVELVNVSAKTLDLSGVTIADSVVVRHTFAAGTELPPGQAFVVWGAGAPACAGVTRFAVASGGQLGLNDGGDTIVVATADATPVQLLSTTFGAATPNVSSNLSPELTGTSYMRHDMVSGAMGAWSPGKRVDGAAF